MGTRLTVHMNRAPQRRPPRRPGTIPTALTFPALWRPRRRPPRAPAESTAQRHLRTLLGTRPRSPISRLWIDSSIEVDYRQQQHRLGGLHGTALTTSRHCPIARLVYFCDS
uniref:Uncharacterized protein n=1 Tax=Arundo donax TaxID=35708 RepID=A0A0A9FIW4_ARUDO